jgi:hypothetical protein
LIVNLLNAHYAGRIYRTHSATDWSSVLKDGI